MKMSPNVAKCLLMLHFLEKNGKARIAGDVGNPIFILYKFVNMMETNSDSVLERIPGFTSKIEQLFFFGEKFCINITQKFPPLPFLKCLLMLHEFF